MNGQTWLAEVNKYLYFGTEVVYFYSIDIATAKILCLR